MTTQVKLLEFVVGQFHVPRASMFSLLYGQAEAAGGTKDELKRLTEPEWTPAAQPGPEIVSFNELNLPDFPTSALPDVLRQWVVAESHATQTPEDSTRGIVPWPRRLLGGEMTG